MPHPLTAASLVAGFSARGKPARNVVAVFHDALSRRRPAAFDRWNDRIAKASGFDPEQDGPARASLARLYGMPSSGGCPRNLLFAVHTYYALIARLLASHVLQDGSRSLESGTGTLYLVARQGSVPNIREPVLLFKQPATRESWQDWEMAGIGRMLGGEGQFFDWYLDAWSPAIQAALGEVAEAFAPLDVVPSSDASSQSGDLLKPLYQSLIPGNLRRRLGEFYTPDWLAEHLLDRVGYAGEPQRRLLDPSCGSGTFLLAAIRRMRRRHEVEPGTDAEKGSLAATILRNIVGFELNPVAALAARVNYLIAIADLLSPDTVVDVPVYLCDSILDGPPESVGTCFDCIAGNPPWIAWDNLPADYREATKGLWRKYGLFSLSANQARHGGAKKDLAMLMTYVSADRYLKPDGRLGMVVTQTLFQTKGAGDGFRRFRLGPEGEPLRVVRIDDLVALRPFADAANRTSTVVLEKGRATEYPVPYVRWLPGNGSPPTTEMLLAEPIDPAQPGSPWFVHPPGFRAPLAELIGPSAYEAHLGANTGGANGVYWLRLLDGDGQTARVENLPAKGKAQVEQVAAVIEPDLLYPLLRWGDVAAWRAIPSGHLVLPQDAATRSGIPTETLRRNWPRTFGYLQRFEPLLRRRAAYRRYQDGKPFYSMYNVGPYTLAPTKVVWRRMDRRVRAAVVGPWDDPLLGPRPVVPQETCALIAVEKPEEAHFLCALLNSALIDLLVTAHSVRGGKGFATPSMLDYLRLPRYDPADARHQQLAAHSREAHQAAAALPGLQTQIDRLTAELWGLEGQCS